MIENTELLNELKVIDIEPQDGYDVNDSDIDLVEHLKSLEMLLVWINQKQFMLITQLNQIFVNNQMKIKKLNQNNKNQDVETRDIQFQNDKICHFYKSQIKMIIKIQWNKIKLNRLIEFNRLLIQEKKRNHGLMKLNQVIKNC